MGLIRAAGNLCYVECDTRNCTKKIEHIDENASPPTGRMVWMGEEGQSMDLPELCGDFKPETQRSYSKGTAVARTEEF